MALKRTLARALLEERVIPRIDKGDPPDLWVERVLIGIEEELQTQVQEALFLAHFISAADPELARQLRDLTAAMLSVARTTEVKAI
jgi:hypothetical protein